MFEFIEFLNLKREFSVHNQLTQNLLNSSCLSLLEISAFTKQVFFVSEQRTYERQILHV
jgi:hypothetical protein